MRNYDETFAKYYEATPQYKKAQAVEQAFDKFYEAERHYKEATHHIETLRQQYDAAWEKVNDAWEQEEANNG